MVPGLTTPAILMILLGLYSLLLHKKLVEWRRHLFGLTFPEAYRRRLDMLHMIVGVVLLVFGVAMLAGLRLFLLFSAVVNLLLSTILFRTASRPFIDWYIRAFKFPVQMQRVLRDDRVVRAWGLGISALSVIAWWYFGTPEGDSAFRAVFPRTVR